MTSERAQTGQQTRQLDNLDKHTPLNSLEHGGLQRLRKSRVQSSGLMAFTFDGLEIVKTAFPSDFALELFQSVERHAGSICS